MVAPPVRAVVAGARLTESGSLAISIIIPTLNEVETLRHTLTNLYSNIDQAEVEVIVSDGGSTDNTIEIAGEFPCQIVLGKSGRARQMHDASLQANGNWLLFLHADSALPSNWQHTVKESKYWGFFQVRLSGNHWLLRIVETAMVWRSRLTSIGTGDQGLFFQRDFYQQLGGYVDIPIMEDIAICKQAKHHAKPTISRSQIVTSSRRWEKNGICRTVLQMWGLRLAYWLGAKPERLHRLYYPDHCR